MTLLACAILITSAAATPPRATDSSFNLAAAVAHAEPGSIIVVPSGIHAGPIVIEKRLTLSGEPGAIIDGHGEGDVVRIEAPDVTIDGLVLRGTGIALHHENAAVRITAPRAIVTGNTIEDALFGILVKGGAGCLIRGNTIRGKDLDIARRGDGIRLWEASNSILEDNFVTAGRDVVMWYSSGVTIRGNRVSDSRYGLHFMFTDDNVVEDNILEGNSVGCFLMYSKNLTLRRNVFRDNRGPSGYGLGLKDMDGVDASDNIFLANRVGIYLDNSPSSMTVHDLWQRNLIACNDVGVVFMSNVKRNSFADNSFIDNIEQVSVISGGELIGNSFTVDGRGNYWSDYNGYDLDGDGLGDLAYRSESLFENLMDREPKLRLFLFSPAQQAMEMASKAFPAVKPHPKLTDIAPLMAPVRPDLTLAQTGSAWPMLGLAGGLLGFAGAVLFAGRPDTARAGGAQNARSAEGGVS